MIGYEHFWFVIGVFGIGFVVGARFGETHFKNYLSLCAKQKTAIFIPKLRRFFYVVDESEFIKYIILTTKRNGGDEKDETEKR